MNYGAIVDLDEPAIEVRGWSPLRSRGRLVAMFTIALAADFGMRLAFDRMIGSLPWTMWVLTATEWIGGLCALLIPVAIVVRTPDAWISRRALVLGVVLGAAGELLAAAGEGVISVNWWLLPSGIEPGLRFPLEQSIYWSERLVSIAGAVLVGFALTQARTRPVPRRAWPWIGGCLLVGLSWSGREEWRPRFPTELRNRAGSRVGGRGGVVPAATGISPCGTIAHQRHRRETRSTAIPSMPVSAVIAGRMRPG